MSSDPPLPDPEAGRLDSWKQIAAYLDKSERTVRRWQQTEGLPVHKHQHLAKGSVWAYQHEIDAWLAVRRISPEPLLEEPAAPTSGPVLNAEAPPFAAGPVAAPRFHPVAAAVGFAGVLLAVAIGGWAYLHRPSTPAPIPASTPFTALPGMEYGAAASPDGRSVAFFWGSANPPFGIYVKNRDSEQPVPVATGDGFAYSPAWSPDGKTIAFLRRTQQDGTWLCLVGATGGPVRNLVKLSDGAAFFASSRHVSWGMDGSWLLVPMSLANQEEGIYRISLDGGRQRMTEIHPAHSPMLGPDGKSFAYVRDGGSPHGQYQIALQRDDKARIVFRGQGMPGGLDWAPGGDQLIACLPAILPAHGRGPRLYRLALEENAAPALLGPAESCSTVTVARSERTSTLWFAVARDANGSLWQTSLDRWEQPQEVTPSSRSNEYPSFSPDGKAIAFVSDRSGRREIWMAEPDGSSPRRITDGAFAEGRPDWSPDGSQLLFGSAASNPKGMMTVPIAGGSARLVPLGGQEAEWPAWSRDGRHIYYSSGSQLWRCRADGTERTMLRDGGWQIAVAESPDRQALYVVKLAKRAELVELPVAGGPERIVMTLSDRLVDRHIAVTPGGLYFATAEGLWQMRFGERPTLVRKGFLGTRPVAVLRGLTVAPDESRILWSRVGRQESDLEQILDFR